MVALKLLHVHIIRSGIGEFVEILRTEFLLLECYTQGPDGSRNNRQFFLSDPIDVSVVDHACISVALIYAFFNQLLCWFTRINQSPSIPGSCERWSCSD